MTLYDVKIGAYIEKIISVEAGDKREALANAKSVFLKAPGIDSFSIEYEHVEEAKEQRYVKVR